MAAPRAPDFLVEIGTEELPPKALRGLMQAFESGLVRQFAEHRIRHGAITGLASPRRIAAIVSALAPRQDDRESVAKGPPLTVAFDDEGRPRPAALAFAKKCGVDVANLGRLKTGNGEWLSYLSTETGGSSASLLPGIVERALQALPIPRRMRWADSAVEFVRPVHWVVMLHGKELVAGSVLGVAAGRFSRGHRFLSSGEIEISEPGEYLATLETSGHVLADFAARQKKIIDDVTCAASAAGGTVAADDSLYEEVAALTEWPVVMTGHFDEAFLELPAEAIIASLTGHQRYFPIIAPSGALLAAFVVVTNLESREPEKVREGNERVIRSRLADASFFWRRDRKTTLVGRYDALGSVVYQKGLGSLRDKSARVEALCAALAHALEVPGDAAMRAAHLAKCDLLTGMVGEFPGLQGVMGSYYARADGETDDVAAAIGEQYLPKFAGDSVPASRSGKMLALADKLDTLAGIFALGEAPSGNKDPFGLRRAALGVVRILFEGQLELGLGATVKAAVDLQPIDGVDRSASATDLHRFISERLRSFYSERPDVSVPIFESVEAVRGQLDMSLPDFDQRIQAVTDFAQMAEASSLASANKRISNILRKSPVGPAPEVDVSLLQEAAEVDLFRMLQASLGEITPLQKARQYGAVLARLAVLKDPVDRFFDDVMVMSDDEGLMRNRLALLARLREPFHLVADISRLTVAKSDG